MSEIDLYLLRERQERDAARAACDGRVRDEHLSLAAHYAQLLAARLDPAGHSAR